jgi:hypothetical protein
MHITFDGDRVDLLRFLPKNGTCAEIGVLRGDFSAEILAVTNPKQLFLIDTWKQDESWLYCNLSKFPDASQEKNYMYVCERFVNELTSGQMEIRRGWSVSELPKLGMLDWGYIDANHDYENVSADLNALVARIKPDGFIMGHDWGQFGVKPAVEDFLKAHPEFYLTFVTNEKIESSFLLARWAPSGRLRQEYLSGRSGGEIGRRASLRG